MRTGCPRQRGVTRESFSVGAAWSRLTATVIPGVHHRAALRAGSLALGQDDSQSTGGRFSRRDRPPRRRSAWLRPGLLLLSRLLLHRHSKHRRASGFGYRKFLGQHGILVSKPAPASGRCRIRGFCGQIQAPFGFTLVVASIHARTNTASPSRSRLPQKTCMCGKEARRAGSTSPVLAIKRNRDQFAALSGPRLAYQGNAPSGALSSQTRPASAGLSSVT